MNNSEDMIWVVCEGIPQMYCMLSDPCFLSALCVVCVHAPACTEQYCVWTDGLCALLGREMGSDLTRSDLDTLISMEMKLRLLDLENIAIPEAPPPVPKEPSTYNFTYNYG